MKKVLVVLVVAVAMLLVGCPQPAGSSIPDEMTVSSVSLFTVTNGVSLNTGSTTSVEDIMSNFSEEPVTATLTGEKYTIEPSVVVKKVDLDAMMNDMNEGMSGGGVEAKTTYTFDNGHLTLTMTITGDMQFN